MQNICIVIPCYNEAGRFDHDHFKTFFYEHREFSFCFVNDGSTDDTAAILENLVSMDPDRISLVNMTGNMGKAEAIRKGMQFCLKKNTFEYIGFIDADFSAPLNEVIHVLDFCHGKLEHAIIAGSRVKRLGADIVRNPRRHYLGRIFATIAGIMMQFPIYDSQCGLKFFRTDMAGQLFKSPFITKWLFDLELWFRLCNLIGLERAKLESLEVPLNEWQEKGGSKLTLKYVLKTPLDLVRIYFKYKNK